MRAREQADLGWWVSRFDISYCSAACGRDLGRRCPSTGANRDQDAKAPSLLCGRVVCHGTLDPVSDRRRALVIDDERRHRHNHLALLAE